MFSNKYMSRSVRIWKSRLQEEGNTYLQMTDVSCISQGSILRQKDLQIISMIHPIDMPWHESGPALTYFFLAWSIWTIILLWSINITQILKIASAFFCSSSSSAAGGSGGGVLDA